MVVVGGGAEAPISTVADFDARLKRDPQSLRVPQHGQALRKRL